MSDSMFSSNQPPHGWGPGQGPADEHAAPMEQGGAAGDGDSPSPQGSGGPWPGAASGAPGAGAASDPPQNPFIDDEQRQLVLVKHGHRYVFRYERGEESKVLAGLVDMARDPESELDWFDAAVLSHQLGERMSEQLQHLRNSA